MNRRKILKIIQVNQSFYKNIAKSFSSTRRGYWEGWDRAMSPIAFPTHSTIKVMDVGCGNGRFFGFLKKRFPEYDVNYLGVDSCQELIDIAKKKYPRASFLRKNMLLSYKSPVSKYNLVVCFGVAHHIPDVVMRHSFFKKIGDAVMPGGFLSFTLWEFDSKKGTPSDYEENSYYLTWDKNPELKRFCHLYTQEEKEKIISLLRKQGFGLITSFRADGKNKESNQYFIFRKLDTIDP